MNQEPAPFTSTVVEHVTGRGMTLRGMVRADLSQEQAKALDPNTFAKDSGWFIREQHLASSGTELHGPLLPGSSGAQDGPAILIDAVMATKVSFATHQCDVPILRELRLVNAGTVPLYDIRLEISSDPPVFAHREWRLDRVPAGAEVAVSQRDLQLNAGMLLQLNEAVRCMVTLRANSADNLLLAERHLPVELLARTEWGGSAMPELLAAFVLPNDPAVSRLLKAASEVLRRAGKPDGMEGYQSKDRQRSWEIASAIWSAVAAVKLSYAEPPKSFEVEGQKVRTPSAVLETGLATCLDTTLLFAAVLEQAGLYPVLVLVHGHALVGVWLQPQQFATLMINDAATLRKRVALQELVVFETTCATGGNPGGFGYAIGRGLGRIDEAHERDFLSALDVRRARMQRIRPLALTDTPAFVAPEVLLQPGPAEAMEQAPTLPEFDIAEPDEKPATPEGRLQRWQRKLLDLTTRNRLLNIKPGTNAIALLCPDPARVEDDLADGKRFRVMAAPSIAASAGRDAALHAARTGVILDEAYARQSLDRGELLSPNTQDRLDTQLVELYRKARLDLAEGGANTMFLAVGFLLWRKTTSNSRVYRAPLILLPVKLERSSARASVRLSHREDPPQFNLTLLQMLRQDFQLDIPELAGSLPQDASGLDVQRVLTIVRRAVRDMPGFEVAEDMLLGAFSFAKYLMWKDLTDRADTLKRNAVVRHLLETPDEPYVCAHLPPKPEALDAEVAPADLYMPLPADSSQVAAVVGSARGCDFVLDGPPGTGKSQTIANMIAHNLALGRTVLFVAEKRAALDVVQRRLEAHGLGPFCLELHSNKAVKQEVLRQLDTAWCTSHGLPEAEWARLAAELKTCRDGLNRLVAALHHVHPNGMTLFGAIGRVVRDGRQTALHLGWPSTISHDNAQLEALHEAARRLDLQRLAGLAGRNTVLSVINRTEWSNAWQADLMDASAAMGQAALLTRQARDTWEAALCVNLASNQRGLAASAVLAAALIASRGFDLGFAFIPTAARAIEHAAAALSTIIAYQAEAARLSAPLSPDDIRALPIIVLETEWSVASNSIFFLAKGRKAAVARKLSPAALSNPAQDLPLLHVLQDMLKKLDVIDAAVTTVPAWAGAETDTERLAATLAAAGALRGAVAEAAETPEQLIALRVSLRKLCTEANDLLAPEAAVGRAAVAFIAARQKFATAAARFGHLAMEDAPLDAPDVLSETCHIAEGLRSLAAHLNPWCAWVRARNAASTLGLGALIDAIQTDELPAGGAAAAFDHAYSLWWATGAIDADPAVRDFNLLDQTDAISRFRTMDRQFTELTQLTIRARLSGNIPSKDTQQHTSGFNVLAHQLKLKQSRKPLRELIGEMGPALRTLAPCLLMSPLSIAQYLPPETAIFDLVIFDEASQIAPWDAIGAIARGHQMVVVGDPKQMPPTSFFDKSGVTDGQDSADQGDSRDGVDQESILDECIAARLPQRRLTWHYRSRNESLIAFSNHRYYDSELITFPAPVTRDRAVSLRQVPGAWGRGKARNNPIEAGAIVAEAVSRLLSAGFIDERGVRLTLAIITLNAEQQKLVEDLLDRARAGNPALEPFFAETSAEPVIVRNLETVQGDERDVVLLSIGYGPEEPGGDTMPMNFGPLNREGGWRRLNVAITRARREMVLFTSFPATLIDLNRTSARAVHDLKRFMDYAERGTRILGEVVADSTKRQTTAFEEAVAEGLRSRGWQAVPQVGVSRFRIDLAVVHPDRPGEYLMGVECDGESYQVAATARDRDRVRDEVLTGLGWALVRTWSMEWWLNSEGALDRLDAALNEELKATHARADAETQSAHDGAGLAMRAPATYTAWAVATPVDVTGEPLFESNDMTVEAGGNYRFTHFDDMTGRMDPSRFQEPDYTPVLRAMIQRVLDAEAPIRDTALADRIARAHGFRRTGGRIRDRVLGIARGMAHVQTESEECFFVWLDAADPACWDLARYPAGPDDLRPLEDIALPELSAALKGCLADDRLSEVARRFGLRRITAGARNRLIKATPADGHFV